MNLFKEISLHEVYPALGCTEPAACAYACAVSAYYLNEPIEYIELIVDKGTYKNGSGVVIPNSEGLKGNLIAAVLGAFIADKDLKLEILQKVTPQTLQKAKNFINEHRAIIKCNTSFKDLYIEANVIGKQNQVTCIIENAHTNITQIIKNEEPIYIKTKTSTENSIPTYKEKLKKMQVSDFFAIINNLDEQDFEYLKKGINLNLSLVSYGDKIGKTAFQLKKIQEEGLIADDMFFTVKHAVCAAIDARMGGVNLPAMTSGGSGNQGIITILVPYFVGTYLGVDEKTILKSIAFAHILNAYIKAHIGALSVICGCAVSAGIAAASAIVYQKAGEDINKIMLTLNNVIGDLSGLICDGAKFGCSMKAISSVDSAIRSSLMALKGYGLTVDDGLISFSIEETLKNLSKIIFEGMYNVDPTLVSILEEKALNYNHKATIQIRKRSAVF